MKITKAKRLAGRAPVPGDKSISHRAALIGAAAEGTTVISNFASSADCSSTLACLSSLGIGIDRDGNTVRVQGRGKQGFSAPSEVLDCGNSGTTARLLSGLLAGQPFHSTLDGDASLRSRPMRRIIEPLGLMGAEVRTATGTLPMEITGRKPLAAIRYELPVASAQIKSCVLLAGLNADGVTAVSDPASPKHGSASRDHTEIMLRQFGAEITTDDAPVPGGFVHSVRIAGDSRLSAREIRVPGDISAAAFLLVAAACVEGSDVELPSVGINPTRAGIIDALRRMGARIGVELSGPGSGEPVGTLSVIGGIEPPGEPVVLSGSEIPNLIDELPVLAVMGTRLPNGLEVRDAAELRVKESDRISAVVGNLRKMGADADERKDGFFIGPSKLKGTRVDSFGDHRIAMAFAVAGLLAEGETVIDGAGCVAVSFPGFFDVISKLAEI